jgi:hypothetical protein
MKKALLITALLFSITLTAQEKKCKGTTKAGQPCKSIMVSKSGYCRAHDPNAIHCAGTTASGKPCGMIVKSKGEKCRIHTK